METYFGSNYTQYPDSWKTNSDWPGFIPTGSWWEKLSSCGITKKKKKRVGRIEASAEKILNDYKKILCSGHKSGH